MTTPDPLLLQFATTRPDQVAELVSDYSPDEISGFLAELPGDVAALVCARMPSRALSELLDDLDPAIIRDLLVHGEHTDVLTLVSHLHQDLYPRILETAEGDDLRRLSRLLDSRSQTLAALASTNFLRVQSDTPCEEVANDLITTSESAELPIFVVDDTGAFIGIVTTQAVISKSHQKKPVSNYMKPVEPLPGNLNATTALAASQWLTAPSLPVVDSDRRIIGAITREELTRVARESAEGNDPGLEDLFSELSTRYLDLCANVVSMVFKNPKENED